LRRAGRHRSLENIFAPIYRGTLFSVIIVVTSAATRSTIAAITCVFGYIHKSLHLSIVAEKITEYHAY
jgi:hypothetical protein